MRISREVEVLLVISLLLVASVFAFWAYWSLEIRFKLTVGVTYENRGEETWRLREDDMVLHLFANSSWQRAYLRSTSHPIMRFSHDPDGNPVITLDLEKEIPPNSKKGYNATYEMVYRERRIPHIIEDLSGTLNDIPDSLRSEYCKPTSLWQSDISAIRETALSIAGDETRVLSILERFVTWIVSNISYGSSEVPKYPNETFYQHIGDCDDQANLLITFCRAVGIPAYLQIGCIYIPDRDRELSYWSGHLRMRLVNVGWHGWAVVYVPPWGWLPVDLTYAEGDLSTEPLNSILGSAMIKRYAFHYLNIVITDYVAETRLLKEFLEKRNLYVYEKYHMEIIKKPFFIQPLSTRTFFSSQICFTSLRLTLRDKRMVYILKVILRNIPLESER